MRFRGSWGDEMNGPVICAALLGALAFLPTTTGFAQQPAGVRATGVHAPTYGRRADGAYHAPQAPKSLDRRTAETEVSNESRPEGTVKKPERSSVEREIVADIQANIDEEALLLPVVHPAFWAIHPGGITRFLISSPLPIDPEQKLGSSECQEIPTMQH
jgi:hypothetical protein